jgi:hypothetical protein
MVRSKDRAAVARRWAERILEDEALAVGLADDAAESLLEWGLSQIDALARQSAKSSQKELDERFAALRSRMRRVAVQAGEVAPESQPERVLALLAEDGTESETPAGC